MDKNIQNTTYTPEMIWAMFAETDRKFQEMREESRETNRKFQETDHKFREMREESKETTRKLDKVAKMISGVGKNNGDVAEDYFFNRLSTTLSVGNVEYDKAVRNLETRTKKLQGEYDIVLINSKRLLIIEVKYKLHPDDITIFIERKLPKFRALFPEYKDYIMYAGVATMALPNTSLELALKNGLLVLTQTGDNIKIINEDDLHNNNLKKW